MKQVDTMFHDYKREQNKMYESLEDTDKCDSPKMNEESLGMSQPHKSRRFKRLGDSNTYNKLIIKAISTSENQGLTIREIYAWFEANVNDLKESSKETKEGQTWKNTIRHSLSANSIFKRFPNPKKCGSSVWRLNLKSDSDNSEHTFGKRNIIDNSDDHHSSPKRQLREASDLQSSNEHFTEQSIFRPQPFYYNPDYYTPIPSRNIPPNVPPTLIDPRLMMDASSYTGYFSQNPMPILPAYPYGLNDSMFLSNMMPMHLARDQFHYPTFVSIPTNFQIPNNSSTVVSSGPNQSGVPYLIPAYGFMQPTTTDDSARPANKSKNEENEH